MSRTIISSIVMLAMVLSSIMGTAVAADPVTMAQVYAYAKAGNLQALSSLKKGGHSLETITDADLMGLGTLDMNYRLSDSQALHFAYRADVRSGNGYFDEALSNPFVDMTDSYALTHRFKLNDKTAVSFGAALGKNGFFEGDEDLNEEFNRSMSAFSSELSWQY